ncbi:hypothetical protein JCM12141A_57770 [Mycolicibacterium hodleri]
MTEQPPHDETTPVEPTTTTPVGEPAPAAGQSVPAQSTSRWDRTRPHGRIGQLAGILVAIAAATFIVGSIFVAGFALGSEVGGEHHGHGEGSYSQGEGDHHGDGESRDSRQEESGGDSSGEESPDGSDHQDGGEGPRGPG